MKQKHIYNLAALLLASSAAFISCSDTDLDGPQPDGDRGASVVFNIKDIQQYNIAKVAAATRAGIAPTLLYTPGLTQEDLAPRRLEAVSSDGLDACLIETTVEGINPTKPDPSTRAKVETSIEHDFTSLGYRGETAGTISGKPEWFYSKKTKKNGELYETHFWSWGKPYGRFYAIYPEATAANKITLSPVTHQGTPYLDFEVEGDVADQHDLMTACSGVVHYDTQNTAPTTNLEFRHALTAVKFAVGNNLSWDKKISNIEINNVVYKGRYILSDKLNGDGAGWVASSLTDRTDISLTTNPNIDTKKDPGAIITGAANDNYTFYMIPQRLTGNNVKAVIYFTDNTTIEATLTGEWKAGTTKTYKLSHTNSNWTYEFSVVSPPGIAYNASTSGNYSITSYRQAPDGTKKPVKWEVVGYDGNNDGNYTMDANDRPSWFTSISKTQGNGGTTAETGTATVSTSELIDSLTARIKTMKDATPKGNSSNYYDLSTKGSADRSKMNTANCYIISASGYYKLPLVYGNAITNGQTNEHSYKTSITGTVLGHFIDHAGQPITNPWIGLTNGGANVPSKAKIIWADEPSLIMNPTVTGSGNNAYLQFRVLPSALKQGNAVIAVTNNAGTVLWSWHLWFAPQSALNTIEVTNHQNKKYKFTKENIGWKYTVYKKTTYDTPRIVKVKVRQTSGNNGTKKDAVLTIIQNHGLVCEGYCVLFQWGRKDAFPGIDGIPVGTTPIQVGGYNMGLPNTIQQPDKFSIYEDWYKVYLGRCTNIWSMDSPNYEYNDDPVVKTIYDPSPAGFKVPASKAFTGFTTTGSAASGAQMNVTGEWVNGWNFWTNDDKTATIFIPKSATRAYNNGVLQPATGGFYWTSARGSNPGAICLDALPTSIGPLNDHVINHAFPIRPVADE